MPNATRRRRLTAVAATAVLLASSACGSDGSGDSSDETGSSDSASTSADSSSSAGSDDSDSGSGSSATVDGSAVTIDGWRAICARSDNGKKGSAVLMEDVSLDELKERDYEIDSISAHFDITGDTATLQHVRIDRPQDQRPDEAIGDLSYSAGRDADDAEVTMTEEAVHVEGTGTETSTEGKTREGISFSIDVECSGWEALTDDGDVAPPT